MPARHLTAAIAGILLACSAYAQVVKTYPEDELCTTERLCRRCDGPACLKVAKAGAWPDLPAGRESTPFHIGLFKVRFPGRPSRFQVMGGGDIVAHYENRAWIAVALQSAAAAGIPERDHDATPGNVPGGELSRADMPRIQFTKTPDDSEPANIEDRRIWRSALSNKHSLFADASDMTVATRGPLTAYMTNGEVADQSGFAFVVHRRVRDSFLMVSVKGFRFDDLRRVVSSIEPTRE